MDNSQKEAIFEGKDAELKPIQIVCVFCGCSDRINEPYLQAARSLSHAIADRGLTIIYGGGATGLMGALADTALERGSKVIGILPKIFDTPILAHHNLSELRVVDTMHERKAAMIHLADAFIALPGGFGTFEELLEVLTWAQIRLHTCPIGILNTNAYFDPFLALIEHARSEGFIYDEHRSLLISETNPHDLLDLMTSYNPPEDIDRWVNREIEI
jgi:uncharacterized protein (TIGR00730 family)